TGAEVIHLGHNRSAKEVVLAAVQEDAHAIAVSSYQGGHVEYFSYVVQLLADYGASHIKVFGGGGGTIIPREVKLLHERGVDWIFTPEDGRKMGLQGMVNEMLRMSDIPLPSDIKNSAEKFDAGDPLAIARMLTYMEEGTIKAEEKATLLNRLHEIGDRVPVLGITGTGGAGKSSLIDELILRFLEAIPNKKVALLSIDPPKRKTGGALLGDRIRMNAIFSDRVFMRSVATRKSRTEIANETSEMIDVLKAASFDLIIVETSGIGQGDAEITEISDFSLYVMTAEFGAPTQLEKIDMIDYADFIAINKFEQKGAEDALIQVRKQYERSRLLFHENAEDFPIFGTSANQFNDPGVNQLFIALMDYIQTNYD